MAITAQQLALLQQQINGIGGGGLLSDPTIVGIIQRIQNVLSFIQMLLGEIGGGATGPAGPSGSAGPTGPTGPTGPGSSGGGPLAINLTAAKGPGVITVLATDINDGVTAYDEIIVPVTGGSGFGTALTIAADPGGAGAYKVGARLTLEMATFGVAADATIRIDQLFASGLYSSNTWNQPLVSGPTLDSWWQFILKYAGSDIWLLDGQNTGAFVL